MAQSLTHRVRARARRKAGPEPVSGMRLWSGDAEADANCFEINQGLLLADFQGADALVVLFEGYGGEAVGRVERCGALPYGHGSADDYYGDRPG